MASDNGIWQPLAIVVVVCGVALGLLLYWGSPQIGPSRSQEPEAAAPTPSQPPSPSPEPKLTSQISVLLKDADPKVRARALALLAAWKPAEIKPQVGEMLAKDADVDVKFAALSAIGEQKIVEAFGAVLEATKAEDVAVRRKAVAVLGQLSEALSAEQREEASDGVVAGMDAEVAKLGHALTIADFGSLHPYILALGGLKTKPSTDALLKLLATPEVPLIRRQAAEALKGHLAKEHEKEVQKAWRMETDRMAKAAIEKLLVEEPFGLVVDPKKGILVPSVSEGP